MSDELIFYTNPMSRGRIAHWMLEEVGEPYRVEYIGYDSIKDPAYLAVNPMGKVPALVHRGKVVTEGAAICAYLADAFPAAGLAPAADSPDRADYLRWLFFAAGPVEQAVTNRSLGVTADADKSRMLGYGSYGDALDALESAVAGKRFIAGDRFSAADVYVGSQIGWGLMFKSIEARPAFIAYWEGIADRPAKARADAANEANMAPRQG